MPFRSQAEALRHRVSVLERELEAARDDVDQVTRMRSAVTRVVGASLVLAVTATVGFELGSWHGESATTSAFTVLHPQSIALSERAELTWRGHVLEGGGEDLPAGTPCEIHLDLTRATGAVVVRSIVALEVRCGPTLLYETLEASTESGVLLGCGLQERSSGSIHHYRLICTDQAADWHRAELSVDTDDGTARIVRDAIHHPLDIRLAIDPESARRVGDPLLSDTSSVRARSHRIGEIVEVTGSPTRHDGWPTRGVAVGSPCWILVDHAMSAGDSACSLSVTCGGELLYGGPGLGLAACLVEGGEIRGAVDVEPSVAPNQPSIDPILLLDMAARRLVVASNHPGGAYLVEVRLGKG